MIGLDGEKGNNEIINDAFFFKVGFSFKSVFSYHGGNEVLYDSFC